MINEVNRNMILGVTKFIFSHLKMILQHSFTKHLFKFS